MKFSWVFGAFLWISLFLTPIGAMDRCQQEVLKGGDMSLPEMLRLLHGGKSYAPTPDSLIGKYLSETGASTLVRGFTREPNQFDSPHIGPKRLVIAVSEQSFAAYSRYLLRPEIFGVHGHALVSNNGKLYSYTHAGVEYRLPSAGHALPQVVLKSSEAIRLQYFWELFVSELNAKKGYSLQNRAMHPWSIPHYSGNGGYVNCTHWIGNIPVGDETVYQYGFPRGDNAEGGMLAVLKPYKLDEPLVTRVWTYPGHAQLSDVLGIREHNLRGNMASPGFVIHTLLAETPIERVPFVVYIAADHTAPIDPDFNYTVERAN